MKLVLHIVRKDFLRLRWPLAGWLLVVVLKLAIGFSLVLSGGFAGWPDSRIEPAISALRVIEGLFTWMLTAMLVQEDLLVGTTQFWLTRPISGARLLGAKLVGWLLLLWVPAALVTLPWWLTCGFGPREMAWAALELLALQTVAALPAVLMAVLTDTSSRFLVWSFVLLFGAATIPATLALWLSGRMIDDVLPVQVLAGWTTFGLSAVAVIVHQFLRRDLKRSFAGLGAGAVLACAVAVFLPTGWLGTVASKPQWTDWHAERASGVTLSWHSFDGGKQTSNRESVWLNSTFAVKGLPRDLSLASGPSAQQTWRWPGGPVLERRAGWTAADHGFQGVRTALGVSAGRRDEETERFLAKERAERLTGKMPEPDRSPRPVVRVLVSTEVFPSALARMRQTPPAYEASVHLRLLRPEPWIEVPLQSSGWQARAAHGFRLGPATSAVPNRGNGDGGTWSALEVPFVVTRPGFLLNVLSEAYRWDDDWHRPGLFVVHRAGGDLQWDWASRYFSLMIGSVGIQRSKMWVRQPAIRRGEKWLPQDARWLEGATVALVGYREEARFTREVKAERYENQK